MEEVASVMVTPAGGIDGDCKGARFPRRQVTLITSELWDAALFTLGCPALPWTMRRANLLVEGGSLPLGAGSRIMVGAAELEVTGETVPCAQMDMAWTGLRKALAPDGRGGATCKVITGGIIAIGDEIRILRDVPKRKVYLPG